MHAFRRLLFLRRLGFPDRNEIPFPSDDANRTSDVGSRLRSDFRMNPPTVPDALSGMPLA